ncbi:chromosome segregation protein SMC [Haliea atlantica]|nr:chromosome segregation protein SMC [Haliea sp.]
MRLKSIKLAGFKSFVDPTTVSFPSNMCAVVGPNGCGKSNVIDAVRWVMGESSAKNLRGESMTDVIFNGSVNRQPVGQASIELVFDNSDGGVGGEYARYAEISIKRLVTRDAQSEYYLNGTRCRRRDITDIFLGTGLGPRSYAIIEQGMISRLIESRPEELRIFIEEAAGISKYKERRKETESRMRRTLENLERLTDLRDELERQLQHLQRQAQAAEKYTEMKAEERQKKAQLLALQYRELDGQLGDCRRAIGELEVRLEAVNAEHRQVDAAIERHREAFSERSDAFNQVQGTYYSLGAEVARLEQTLKHQQERGQQLHEDLRQTTEALAESRSHLDQDEEKLLVAEEELEQLAPDLDMLAAVEEESAEALLQAEEAMSRWQQRWDEFNQVAAEPRQQAEVQQSRIQHLEQAQQRLQRRILQLEEEQGGLAEGPREGLDALEEEIARSEELMARHEAEAETLGQQLADVRERDAGLSSQLNEARSSLQRLQGRQSSLEALQQAAREDSDRGVRDWLASRQLDQRPRLLDQIQVSAGWQLAVETVLGDSLQAVEVDDLGEFVEALADLESGQLVLVESAAHRDAAAETLASQVSGSAAASGLLAGIYTAADLPAALARRVSLAEGESVITPEGIWLGRHWVRCSRQAGEQGGVIERQQVLEALAEDIAATEARVETLEEEQAAAREQLESLEESRREAQRELQAATRQHSELGARLSAQRARQEQIQARRERLGEDISETREQFQHEQEAMAEARLLLSEAIERMESDSRQREALLTERDQVRGQLDGVRQKARHDKDQAHQAAMRHQSLQTQVQAVREAIQRARGQMQQLEERRASLASSLEENDNPLEDVRLALEEQLEQRLEAEAELSRARDAVAEVEQALRTAERERAGIEQRVGEVRGELEQVRLRQQTLQVQRDTVLQQLREGEHDLEAVLAALPEEASQQAWQSELEKLAARISRLGPINLAAIEEYSQQSERKHYLDAQNEDLEAALETLSAAIRKIDKETRSRFRDTFDRVNSGLQELFPRVFGGGSAYLEMTGEDLLDTGISIMARPPGKKNSTIHLLSGGEKALTAIALVFSIFQLNPAPFCMLDEVDAPLDDANVGRYARMVKEMSEKVQFIYITHNKISMEMADQLMGVTMHEPGVSRLVTVDVEEAAELAAS